MRHNLGTFVALCMRSMGWNVCVMEGLTFNIFDLLRGVLLDWLRSDLDDRLGSVLPGALSRFLSDRLDRRLTRLLDDALSRRLHSVRLLVHFHVIFDLERVVLDSGCEERVFTHCQ